MQIDPVTGRLFTDSGRFLKKLRCPRQKTWNSLHPTDIPGTRHCAECSNSVHDTAAMTDRDLVDLLEANPRACLKVSYTQANCTVRPT
jgi:hypothetical protein